MGRGRDWLQRREEGGIKKGRMFWTKISGRMALLGSSTRGCENGKNLRNPLPSPFISDAERSEKSGSGRDTKLSLDSGPLTALHHPPTGPFTLFL